MADLVVTLNKNALIIDGLPDPRLHRPVFLRIHCQQNVPVVLLVNGQYVVPMKYNSDTSLQFVQGSLV